MTVFTRGGSVIMAGLGYIQYGWTIITWIGKYGLNGNGTQDISRLGDFMSQPGIEQRMYQDWETLCLYQGWNIGQVQLLG